MLRELVMNDEVMVSDVGEIVPDKDQKKDAHRLQMLWGINDSAHVQYPHNALIFSGELGLQPADHLLIAMMLSYARDKGRWVWPSVETLARQMCCSVPALRKRLNRLLDAGLLKVQRSRGREEWNLKPFHDAISTVAKRHSDEAHPGFTSLPTQLVRSWLTEAFLADATETVDGEQRGPLPYGAAYVLLLLLSHEHEQDYAGTRQGVHVSRSQLARRGGMSEYYIGNRVSLLEERGLVEVEQVMRLRTNGDERGDLGRNCYTFEGLRLALREFMDPNGQA
jgi:AraC-like DNA-binding protein